MNVRCPTCQTVFRVDPEKIPATGIKARCSRCSAAFRIEPAPRAHAPAEPPVTAAAASPTVSRIPRAEPGSPAAPAAPVTPAPAVAAAPPVAASRRPSFRNQDPAARAHRIARALVSDIVAYNKDKLQESLAAGTIRNDFREEIRKSWEEYVGQVGLDMARSTPYFRDSLNEILAKGQKMF